MAGTYTHPRTVHPTTDGAAADVVTVGTVRSDGETVEIIHRDGTAPLWLRWNAGGSDPGEDPTEAGDGCYVVRPGDVKRLVFQTGGEVTIRVASFGAAVDYSVEVST